MPHISLEYSPNIAEHVAMQQLCDTLRLAAIETGIFPTSGIRVRAFKADFVSIADGLAAHGFLDCVVKIGAGRDEATRVRVSKHLFAALEVAMQPAFSAMTLGLSFEIREITPETAHKIKNIP
jgi:5-carboxymethyl-2-hydroxymuconate isomerase